MTECLREIEAEEERQRLRSSKGGSSTSPKKSEAAKRRWEARQVGNTPIVSNEVIRMARQAAQERGDLADVLPEQEKLMERARKTSFGVQRGVVREDMTREQMQSAGMDQGFIDSVVPDDSFPALLKELQEGAIMGGLKRSPFLPPGVMRGSEMEGRGHE